MWLEVAVCSLGIAVSMGLQMLDAGHPFARLLPLSVSYAALCVRFLPTRRFQQTGVLFFIGVQAGTLGAWTSLYFVTSALAMAAREVTTGHTLHGHSKITACAALGSLVLYFLFRALGVDRDLQFAPILCALIFSLWIWAIWERRGHSTFKMFVLGAMLVHTVEMGIYLIPHPPESPVTIHMVPLVFFFTPLLYLAIRTARKSPFSSF
jgi:hypothetical protein